MAAKGLGNSAADRLRLLIDAGVCSGLLRETFVKIDNWQASPSQRDSGLYAERNQKCHSVLRSCMIQHCLRDSAESLHLPSGKQSISGRKDPSV
jgi:hypothetical protein